MAACGGGSAEVDDAQPALADHTFSSSADVIAAAIAVAGSAEPAPAPAYDQSPAPRASELVSIAVVAAARQPATADVAQPLLGPLEEPTVTIATVKAGTTADGGALAIALSDIAARARTNQSFASQSWGNLQCNGYIIQSQKLPAAGIHGARLADGRTLRFGLVPDAGSATGQAFEIALNSKDPITARSDRCEMSFPASAAAGIPRKSVFWHAFAVKLPDWSLTTDEQAIAQWHAGDTSGGLLPVYTLLVRGKAMRIVLRYDTAAVPSRAGSRAIVVWSTPNAPINQWVTVVTQALVSQNAADMPFVKTWLNGTQVVDYAGPLGYNQPAVQSYAKQGIYHWVDNDNPWHAAVPTRTLRLKDPVLVRDPQRRYQQATVRALVEGI